MRVPDPTLVSWIGKADLSGPESDSGNCGPLARILAARPFSSLILMSDFGSADPKVGDYLSWLETEWMPRCGRVPPALRLLDMLPPCGGLGLGEIHDLVADVLASEQAAGRALSFNMSSGMPAMQFAFFLLAKTTYPAAELVQASREQGIRTVDFPFEITKRLATAVNDVFMEKAFAQTGRVSRSDVDAADRAAANSLPVLIVGEPGAGKTTLAEDIHRRYAPKGNLVDVNCPGISDDIFDAAFFGFVSAHVESHIKKLGMDPKGFLSRANDGCVLLRDVDTLTAAGQAKLMSALHTKRISRVGAASEAPKIPITCRVIATTSKDLWEKARQGGFRADLLYGLAVNVVEIPPLRNRREDIVPIAEALLGGMLRSMPKHMSVEVQNILRRQDWPGNIHELKNVLARAAIRAASETIEAEDIGACLWCHKPGDDVMGRPFGDGFDIDSLLLEVRRRYIERALDAAGQNAAQAGRLLGVTRQRLANWLADDRPAAGKTLT